MFPTTTSLTASLLRQTSCAFILLFITLFHSAYAAQPSAFSSWAKDARVGGAALWVGISDAEAIQILDTLQAQNVSVIEADSELSNYLTEQQFQQELALMTQFSALAKQRDMKVVWYIPVLEVVTTNGANIPNTMAKDHPDWLQVGLDGQNNVFYGGGGQVFWVEDDAESAWMSPSSSGYRNYLFDRIRRMAATGIDGIWADVPIYADFGVTKWSDFNPEAVARFTSVTGFDAPDAEDWDDPAWRRWIQWRHEELARFLKDMTDEARSQNSEMTVFAETLPTDYNGGTIYGLDGAYLKPIEGLTQVWEVDTMSNNVGMRNARSDDWISFISAMKFARASTGDKPSWVFTYGKQENDAQQVMTQAIIAGNNPYELQVPEMTTTVGDGSYRTRMFSWMKANSASLYDATSEAKVGVYYSSSSRDYVDQFTGLGMFATTDTGGDELWWAESQIDSVYERDYLADYRGIQKLLIHEHIPYQSVVAPTQAELNKYDVVMLPSVEAMSDTEASQLRQFVSQGGTLIITGPNPGGMDQYGSSRSNYALADVLGFNAGGALPQENLNTFGSGKAQYFAARLGKDYMVNGSDSTRATLAAAVRSNADVRLQLSGDDRIHAELSTLGNKTIIQLANFIGLDGNFSVFNATAGLTYQLPAGREVVSVTLSNPDNGAVAPTAVDYSLNGSQLSFSVPLTQYALIEVTTREQTGSGAYPTALPDSASSQNGQTITIDVLANDSGNGLVLDTPNAWSMEGGAVSLSANQLVYTPKVGFNGEDKIWYNFTDSLGRGNYGEVTITVSGQGNTDVPPVGNPDFASAATGSTIQIDVLANDSGTGLTLSEPDPWSFKGGQVSLVNGQLNYQSKADFTGEDKIWYTFSDSQGRSNFGEVTINVTDAPYPVAVADGATTTMNTPVTIYVLANDTGSQLRIIDVDGYSVNGATLIISNGALRYTPRSGFSGSDSFWYAIEDSIGRSNAVAVQVNVN